MDFDRSTQARSWIFDEGSLTACRVKAAAHASSPADDKLRPRKFASGFHSRWTESDNNDVYMPITLPGLCPNDKETLVRFHAHQIQALVGPTAILSELCTSETVLSTAIVFFRRFYFSNSILEFNPRKMAAACAFFAAKAEEEKIDIGLLSHATAVVHLKVQSAPLCRNELCRVSVSEIEEGERFLMEGINYQFRVHHPDTAIRVLATDLSTFLAVEGKGALMLDLDDGRNPSESYSRDGYASPRGTFDAEEQADEYLDIAFDIWQRAIVFSDVPFMFAPGQIGFGIVAIAAGLVDSNGCMGDAMQEYLIARMPLKTEDEILLFSRQVNRIIQTLQSSPLMDLQHNGQQVKHVVAQRAEELRTVFSKASSLRMMREMNNSPLTARVCSKRTRGDVDFTPPRERCYRKLAKVTPTGQYHY